MQISSTSVENFKFFDTWRGNRSRRKKKKEKKLFLFFLGSHQSGQVLFDKTILFTLFFSSISSLKKTKKFSSYRNPNSSSYHSQIYVTRNRGTFSHILPQHQDCLRARKPEGGALDFFFFSKTS